MNKCTILFWCSFITGCPPTSVRTIPPLIIFNGGMVLFRPQPLLSPFYFIIHQSSYHWHYILWFTDSIVKWPHIALNIQNETLELLYVLYSQALYGNTVSNDTYFLMADWEYTVSFCHVIDIFYIFNKITLIHCVGLKWLCMVYVLSEIVVVYQSGEGFD